MKTSDRRRPFGLPLAAGLAFLIAMGPAVVDLAAEPGAAYGNIVAMLQKYRDAGRAVTLRVFVEVFVSGPDATPGTSVALAAAARSELIAALGGAAAGAGAAWSIVATDERPFDQSTKNDATLLAEPSRADLAIVVRIVDYRSAGFDLYETTARLLERPGGRELARDEEWTSAASDGIRASFIDGVRKK